MILIYKKFTFYEGNYLLDFESYNKVVLIKIDFFYIIQLILKKMIIKF